MRPIKISSNIVDQLIEEFKTSLLEHTNVTSRISYSKDLSTMYTEPDAKEKTKVKVCFTASAYLKMKTLVDKCPDEIGWHGIVNKVAKDHYIIHDIIVFPQVVTGVSVIPDQEEYAKWTMKMMMADDDTTSPYFEQFENIRFHGHSHVNMGVMPSGTDTGYQSDMLGQIKDYYIFLIINKSGATNVTIYDVENNLMLEDGDIDLEIILDEDNMNVTQKSWAEEQLQKVEKHTVVNQFSTGYPNHFGAHYGENYTEQYLKGAAQKKEKKEKEKERIVYWDPKLKLWVEEIGKNRKLFSYRKPDTGESVVQLTKTELERSRKK